MRPTPLFVSFRDIIDILFSWLLPHPQATGSVMEAFEVRNLVTPIITYNPVLNLAYPVTICFWSSAGDAIVTWDVDIINDSEFFVQGANPVLVHSFSNASGTYLIVATAYGGYYDSAMLAITVSGSPTPQ